MKLFQTTSLEEIPQHLYQSWDLVRVSPETLLSDRKQWVLLTTSLSPRASMALAKSAKAWAYIEGRDYVLPEDVQAVFSSVCQHRLGLHSDAGDTQIAAILKHVLVPV